MKVSRVLVIGTGEYVTGFGRENAAQSDKSAGVILLALLELKRQGRLGDITICGEHGDRFPAIRKHLKECIDDRYKGLSTLHIKTIPEDIQSDSEAWRSSLSRLSVGDVVIISTPDHLHVEMTKSAMDKKLHVLVVKPLVQKLEDNQALLESQSSESAVFVEMHKRLDPIYADARDQARDLGDFSYMYSYMSQPKSQLDTFRSWAGIHSDISYYLNTHHIDLHAWIMEGRGRPLTVSASVSAGIGSQILGRALEDVIVLKVDWENLPSGNRGVAIYAASWAAPKSDVHSQQRFFYLGHKGEMSVDQAHRGYQVATDEEGYTSRNPLFMQYRTFDGEYRGQNTYGFRSIEQFISYAEWVNRSDSQGAPVCDLPTLKDSLCVTAILEAGRKSLDDGGRSFQIVYEDNQPFIPVGIKREFE